MPTITVDVPSFYGDVHTCSLEAGMRPTHFIQGIEHLSDGNAFTSQQSWPNVNWLSWMTLLNLLNESFTWLEPWASLILCPSVYNRVLSGRSEIPALLTSSYSFSHSLPGKAASRRDVILLYSLITGSKKDISNCVKQ